VKNAPGRTLAAAGIAGAGVAAAVAAYLIVGGLPGLLYAAGIALAVCVGAVAVAAGGSEKESVVSALTEATSEPASAPRWRRKSYVIEELGRQLAATGLELEEHRQALANLAAQRARESEDAHRAAQELEHRIRELEAERDGLLQLVAEEREGFERTLDDLGGGLGRHGNELAELERELAALMAR
jgi:flagellar motility protein MotE (MotC chaperone)